MTDDNTRRSRRRQFLKGTGALVAGGSAGLAGCSGDDGAGGETTTGTPTEGPATTGGTPTSPTGETPVAKVAASHYPLPTCTLAALMAKEKKLYEDNGITISKVTSFSGGGTTIRGIVTGGISAGLGASLTAVVKAYLAGAPIYLCGLTCQSNDIEFHVRPDSDVESIQDLKGQKIAITNPGSITESLAIRSITNADGITLDDVELLYAGGLGEALTALNEGEAAASWNLPPKSVLTVQNDQTRLLFKARKYAPHITQGTIPIGGRVLEEQPDLAAGLMRTFIDAHEYVAENPKETARVWAEANGVPEDVAVTVMTESVDLKAHLGVELTEEVLTSTADTLVTQGVLDEQPPWKEIIRQGPLPEDKRVDWV
ncbi:MAG: ABC transporter substrate-binding protein [Haloferacaceae archaeon]